MAVLMVHERARNLDNNVVVMKGYEKDERMAPLLVDWKVGAMVYSTG